MGKGEAYLPLLPRDLYLLWQPRRCSAISYQTVPEPVPRSSLSIMPNIGMLTQISLLSTAMSLMPIDSLPNQTASSRQTA